MKNLCELLGIEVQSIMSTNDILNIDINNINPSKYDEYINTLSAHVESLKSFQSILSSNREVFQKLDSLVSSGIIGLKDLSWKNVATELKDITEDTVIYVGNLNYSVYKAFHKGKLPPSLKFIVGCFLLESGDIYSIDMEYIETLTVSVSSLLYNISVKRLESIALNNCFGLTSLKLQTVTDRCTINNCSKLTIDGIQSFFPNQKIEMGGEIAASQFSLSQLQSKFNFANI